MERVSTTYDIILLCNNSELGDGLGWPTDFLHSTFSTRCFYADDFLGLHNACRFSSSRMPGCIIASYLLFLPLALSGIPSLNHWSEER